MQFPTVVPVDPQGAVDELLGLRPTVRLAFGAVFAVLGVALTVEMWDVGLVWGLSLFAVALGVVAMISGLLGIRHERCMRAEVARALAQWDELQRELEHARETRQGVGKALTRLGYHDHQVRAWIRERLESDESTAASGRGG